MSGAAGGSSTAHVGLAGEPRAHVVGHPLRHHVDRHRPGGVPAQPRELELEQRALVVVAHERDGEHGEARRGGHGAPAPVRGVGIGQFAIVPVRDDAHRPAGGGGGADHRDDAVARDPGFDLHRDAVARSGAAWRVAVAAPVRPPLEAAGDLPDRPPPGDRGLRRPPARAVEGRGVGREREADDGEGHERDPGRDRRDPAAPARVRPRAVRPARRVVRTRAGGRSSSIPAAGSTGST